MSEIITEDFKIQNLTTQIGEFRITNPDQPFNGFDKNYLILDMGEKTKGDFATCNFLFKSEKFKITSTGSSCGCTNPSFQNTGENDSQFVTVVFDPNKIEKNVNKVFTLYMNNDQNIRMKINLKINN